MVHKEVSHDKITCFLSEREYTSKDLWLEAKSAVQRIEGEERVPIFDDTVSENMWTNENEREQSKPEATVQPNLAVHYCLKNNNGGSHADGH